VNQVEHAVRLDVAKGVWGRLIGLLGRSQAPRDRALCLVGCSAIHTCFMRFPIDLIFVDRCGGVLKVVEGLRTWRAAHCPGAFAAIEAYEGFITERGLRPGDRLRLDPPIFNRLDREGNLSC
jgi:uncharacterized membrane protein (UPF0127 family)